MNKSTGIIILGLLVLAELLWGNVIRLFSEHQPDKAVFLIVSLRLPRVFNAIVAGAGLSVTGLLLQTLFRNPLAGPYILGISSGAAFGIALSIMLFAPGSFWQFAGILTALAGAALVLTIIVYLSRKFSLTVVIIAGMLITGIFGALINVLQFLSPAFEVKNYVLWTMASIDTNINALSVICLTLTVFVIFFVLKHSTRYDALYFGKDYALSMGVDYLRLKNTTLAFTGIIIALITVIYGPVAFAGVIAPHIARMTARSLRHSSLLGHTVFWGIALMLFADWLSHLFPAVLPLNTSLSLIGLPMLFYLLLVRKIG